MTTISFDVEGMVCEEQQGHVNIYNILYLILQGPRVSPPQFLTPWGPKNTQTLLRTPVSAHIPVITFPSLSWRLKKKGEIKG
jgi:hypothetical protein